MEWTILRPFRKLAHFFWRGVDGIFIDGFLEGLAGGANTLGDLFRRLTTGRLHSYLHAFAWGLVLMLGWFLWVATAP